MYLYNEESKAKYGKSNRKAGFKEAMEEIENNVLINDAQHPEEGEQSPAAEEPAEVPLAEEPEEFYPVNTRIALHTRNSVRQWRTEPHII